MGKKDYLLRLIFIITLTLITTSLYSQIKVVMEKKGGVYEVPCEVNGLKLKFVFDTGASNVSLSSSVAEFMLKNDYLKKEDIYDEMLARQADGSTFRTFKVKLKTLNIGGCVLHDVVGVITPHQDSPLLLGQSAIQKLGKISIKDNFLIIDKVGIAEYKGLEKDISFLGLKQYATYDECYSVLCEKYGAENVLEGVTNDIPSITVPKMIFNNYLFDEIILTFEDDYLNNIDLIIYYEKKDINKAKQKLNEIRQKYAKKYTSIKSETLSNGFVCYSIGYEERKNVKDYIKYPISLSIVDYTVNDNTDGEWVSNDYYGVTITYWPYSQKLLYDNNPVKEDEY